MNTSRWAQWLPGISLLAFSVLWLARWPSFPLFLDPYYHLFVARELVAAGGPIAYEWWQAAPVGRPHLYPPVLHLLLAGLMKIGCPPLFTIRLASALVAPTLLASIYLVTRGLFGKAVALASLWMAILPFSWILEISGRLASGLALIELLWLIAALVQRRTIGAACLFVLLLYTHLGLPWIALASVGWFLIVKAFRWSSQFLRSGALALIIGLPWLVHVAANQAMLRPVGRSENDTIELLPPLLLLAAVGAWSAWKQGGRSRLLLGLWCGFCLMAYPFTFRWLSGEGLLPVCLLAGYGLVGVSERVSRHLRWPSAQWLGIVVSAFVAGSPTLVVSGFIPSRGSALNGQATVYLLWPDTTPFHLLGVPRVQQKGLDVRLSGPHLERVARTVTGLTQPGKILWSNAPYAGGLVAALAHRATSSAMFYEVQPAHPFDPIAAAHLIVWFRVTPLPGTPDLQTVLHRYQLQLVAQDALALLFRNPAGGPSAQTPKAVISLWLAFGLLCASLGFIVWDFHRPLCVHPALSKKGGVHP